MVLDSIKSVFALMALIASGFYFAGKPWFGKQGMDFLSRFTVEATIPFYMFYNIYKDVGTRESLISLVSKLPVTFGLILLCLALAAFMGALLKVDGKRRYTFVAASGFPNVVFIGFPIWWYVAPTIINTFLESYDLTGKTIIPFATSGGSNIGKTNERLAPSCKGAKLLEGKVFKGSVGHQELAAWVDGLGL